MQARCPGCQATLSYDSKLFGRRFKCATCLRIIEIDKQGIPLLVAPGAAVVQASKPAPADSHPIKYKCKHCKAVLETDASLGMKEEACPMCKKVNLVPSSREQQRQQKEQKEREKAKQRQFEEENRRKEATRRAEAGPLQRQQEDEQKLRQNAEDVLQAHIKDELPDSRGESQPTASQPVPSGFSFLRDFRRVQWGATLWLNMMRATASGIVLCIALLIAFHDRGAPQSWQMPLYMLMMPLGYLLFLAPLGIIAGALARRGLRLLGLITLFCILDILPGDPVVFILHKVCPSLVPVRRFGVLNFALVIWILRDGP